MAAVPSSLKVDNTLGAAFIGFGVASIVYGIFTAQCYTYFGRYPSDRIPYKILVIGLWLLETIDQAFIGHAVYYYNVSNYANPVALFGKRPVWTLILQIELGALVGTIVKACFAMRVWRFSKHNRLVTVTILLFTFLQMAFSTVYTAQGFALSSLAHVYSLRLFATLSLSVGTATDIMTAAALCWFLRQLRTGYRESDTLVNSLTMYAVNTGILTSAVSLATLILYNMMPDNFVFMGVFFVLSKVYAISFLATLNTRQIIRGRGTEAEDATHHTGNTFYMAGTGRLQTPHDDLHIKSLEIEVHREISRTSDVTRYGVAR